MAYNNYNDLVVSIQGYIKEDDLNSYIGDWIILFEAIAEADLLQHPLNEVRTPYSITSDVWQNLPAGAHSVKSIELDTATGNRWVKNQSNENIVRTYGQFQAGQPEYYAVKGSEIRFGPLADGGYDSEMIYWPNLPDLASNDTNWLYENFPMTYVYGTLLQAEPWLENDQRLQVWQLAYNGAKRVMAQDAKAREFAGSVRSQARLRKV